MRIKLEDIQEAVDFVSFGELGEHSALLDKSTGQIYWYSDSGDLDEIPEAMYDSDDAIEIPHKNDLGLGRQLVFEFVLSTCSDDYEYVRDMFRGPGAYSRYKDLLKSRNLLDAWYDFESKAQEKALREWCEVNGVELTG